MKNRYPKFAGAIRAAKASLIEIIGDRRVLVENHCGITAYSDNKIIVEKHDGNATITGSGLQLAVITKEKIVITGRIYGIELNEKGGE